MKLLYIVTGLSTGGAEMMLYKLLSRLDRERFSPVVISLMDRGTIGDRIAALGIPIHTVGMQQGTLPNPLVLWNLMQIVHSFKPDIIQGWMYHGNLAAQLASFLSKRKIPVVWSIHYSIASLAAEKPLTKAVIQLGARLSQRPARILFVSQISQHQHQALGYCAENSRVIPNGFDSISFSPSPTARLSLRAELGIADQTFLIGGFGRYHPMKDHANFLKAASLLQQTHPDVHFLLAGKGVDSTNQTLQQLIQEGGLQNHVHLLGERQDMPFLMASVDVLASTSAYGEAFPMVIGEAMACGVPCVVTDVGDSGWIVGNTGTVVPPGDAAALATAWQRLVELDSADRQVLGKAARMRIIDCFSLDSVVNRYETLYEHTLLKLFDGGEVRLNEATQKSS